MFGLDGKQLTAVLSGLRLLQRTDVLPPDVAEIYYDGGGAMQRMTDGEINALCARLNEDDSTACVATAGNDSVTENNIAAWLQGQIEDGALDMEGMAARLTRYGLMDPRQFVLEMNERMGVAPKARIAAPAARSSNGDAIDFEDFAKRAQAALRASRLLVAAYTHGLENGGSVDWSELDDANRAALLATGNESEG